MEQYDFKKIGLELRRLRTEHACTQEQIADELGCTVAFISNVENNRAKLNLRVLTYYAKLFHVSVDSILNAGQDIRMPRPFGIPRRLISCISFHRKNRKRSLRFCGILRK